MVRGRVILFCSHFFLKRFLSKFHRVHKGQTGGKGGKQQQFKHCKEGYGDCVVGLRDFFVWPPHPRKRVVLLGKGNHINGNGRTSGRTHRFTFEPTLTIRAIVSDSETRSFDGPRVWWVMMLTSSRGSFNVKLFQTVILIV